ncbi:TatD family deoxyribonuclease [Paenibacillaceae bacterium]|nr:TatD family deoxyribonuclease [Paenibacillaceae bacterium]
MGASTGEGVIDAHIHLDLYPEEEREPLLTAAFAAGVEAVIAVSMQLASCKLNRSLAQRFGSRILPAYGFHPEQPLPDAAQTDELIAWIRERAVAGESFAIGEVGLPYYMRSEAEAAGHAFDQAPYLALLERFVQLAAELDRPIVLHAVYEDAEQACDLLERYGIARAHFHWFKGPCETIERMIRRGYHVSVTPDVAYEQEIQQLVQRYPLELLMVETDGPWPFEGPFSGQQTRPEVVREVARHIAAIKELPESHVIAVLSRTTRLLYHIE